MTNCLAYKCNSALGAGPKNSERWCACFTELRVNEAGTPSDSKFAHKASLDEGDFPIGRPHRRKFGLWTSRTQEPIMPTSPWTDYLRRVAAYLHGGQNALESGTIPPAEQVVP